MRSSKDCLIKDLELKLKGMVYTPQFGVFAVEGITDLRRPSEIYPRMLSLLQPMKLTILNQPALKHGVMLKMIQRSLQDAATM